MPFRRDDPGQPPSLHPPYAATVLRAPRHPPIRIPHTGTELTGPSDWNALMGPPAGDLTTQHASSPIGQRIIVAGHVLDEDRRPVPHTIIEIWQANAAGRYAHARDQWDAPLDPNFTGAGRVVTDDAGAYRFVTIRPGAYPWRNHHNAWRPSHIHFSLLGPAFATRLVTQMYFEDDKLIPLDPIAGAVPAPFRDRMVARFDLATTQPFRALAWRFDIVLRGRDETPFEA